MAQDELDQRSQELRDSAARPPGRWRPRSARGTGAGDAASKAHLPTSEERRAAAERAQTAAEARLRDARGGRARPRALGPTWPRSD